jgi:hypothetical protein
MCDYPSCANQNPILKYCGNCMSIKYCSTHCQKQHWSTHKIICKIAKKEQSNNNSIMNYYNVNESNVARAVNEIPKSLLGWIVKEISYEDRNKKALFYDNSKISGYIISSENSEWKKIPVALSSNMHNEPKCKRIAHLIMPNVDGGVTTFICNCPNSNVCYLK